MDATTLALEAEAEMADAVAASEDEAISAGDLLTTCLSFSMNVSG